MKADIDRIAVISTAHISPTDNRLFTANFLMSYPITALVYEGGILLPFLATEVLTARQRIELRDWGFSDSVVDIIMWAHHNRLQGVRLDRDGPLVKDLHIHMW